MNDISKYYELESLLNESIYLNDKDRVFDTLFEMLSVKLDIDEYIPESLSENVSMSHIFNRYIPLIEAVDEITEAKNNLSRLKSSDDKEKESILKKSMRSFKRLIDWWYKIEPNKKFKMLHIILKILVAIALFVAELYISSKVTNKVLNTKVVNNMPDKIINIGKRERSIKKTIISLVLNLGMGRIIDFITSITSDKIKIAVNKKDLDKNIKEIDSSIDKINEKLSKEYDEETRISLIKTKKELSDTLSKLIKLKDNINKK